MIWISGISKAQTEGILFSTSKWSDILKEAKQNDKLIFMDAHTTWCGPCKWMKANVFPDSKVGNLYNRNFINAYIDMETGEGLDLQKLYGIKFYPTSLYINGNGEVVHKVVGQCSSEDFIQHALDAMSPRRNLKYLKAAYAENSNNFDFVRIYLKALKKAYELEHTNTVALEFLSSKDVEMWQQNDSWLLIREYVTDATSPVFNYLVDHQPNFERYDGKEAVSLKIYQTYLSWPIKYIQYSENDKPMLDENEFSKFLFQVESSNYQKKNEILAKSKLTVYFALKDWDLYTNTVIGMLKNKIIPMDPAGAEWLYSYADNINRFGKNNKHAMSLATEWAKLITEKFPGIKPAKRMVYLNLYALLLEEGGQKRLSKQIRNKIDKDLLKKTQSNASFQQMRIIPK